VVFVKGVRCGGGGRWRACAVVGWGFWGGCFLWGVFLVGLGVCGRRRLLARGGQNRSKCGRRGGKRSRDRAVFSVGGGQVGLLFNEFSDRLCKWRAEEVGWCFFLRGAVPGVRLWGGGCLSVSKRAGGPEGFVFVVFGPGGRAAGCFS